MGRPQRQVAGPPRFVEAFVSAWIAGNAEKATQHLAEDAVYCRHISRDLLPSGGEASGRADIAQALRGFWASFDPLHYRILGPQMGQSTVRLPTEFIYRHQPSGQTLEGRLRLLLTLSGDSIARVDEFYDRAKVEAFLRLFAAQTVSLSPGGRSSGERDHSFGHPSP